MPQLALGVVGSAIGSALLGTAPVFLGLTGGSIGWIAGSMLGSMFQKGQKQEGPRLGDLSVQASTYGVMKPVIYGTQRTAGNVIFCTDKREVVSENTESGKGGPKVTTTTYSYNVDIAIALCEGTIEGIRKIWRNGELIYDVSTSADVGTVLGSSIHAEAFRIYYGDEDQLPDPTIEATVGAGLTPAYRGTAYVVLDHLDCPNGIIPQLSFEVATSAAAGSSSIVYSDAPAVDATLVYASVGKHVTRQFHSFNGEGDCYDVGPNYDEFSRSINFAVSNGGTPIPVQGGPYAMQYFFDGGYSEPLNIRVFDMESGNPSNIYSYEPGSSDNSLRVNFAAYDPITEKFCAAASVSSPDRYEVITIMPGGVTTDVLDDPGKPMAFYDDIIYTCASHDSETWLQSFDGTTGSFIEEIGLGEDAGIDRLLVHVDEGGIFVMDGEVGSSTRDRKVWKVTDVWTLLTSTGRFDNANGQSRTFYACDTYAIAGPSVPSGGSVEYRLIYYTSVEPATVLVADVIEDICVRGGMDLSQVDTTGITDELHGYALTQVTSARANLEPLLLAYFIDGAESDSVLKFRKRADQTVVATIEFEDLGAGEAGSNAEDPFPLTRTQEPELPRSVAVSFVNLAADYQPGTETARRQVTESIHDIATSIPLVTTSDHAAQIAAAMLYDSWQNRNQRRMKLLREFAYLDVGDNVSVEYPEGTFSTKRINRVTDTGLVLEMELSDSDPALYEVTIPGVTPDRAQDGIAYAYPSRAFCLDMPILRNADDDDGFYMAVRSVVDAPWSGALIYKSDGLNYQPLVQATTESVMGVTLTALDNWTGGDIVDERSSVQVDVSHGELSSSTRDAIVSGEANAMLIGSEVVQFHTATEDSPGIYTLTGFLRGRRGTEWAMVDHAVGERVVLLSTAMRRIELTLSEVDTEISYKPVTIGASLDATSAIAFTNTAIGKKPFAPVYLRMSEEAGTRLFTWERRTRMASNLLTDSIPLGEESESYDWELLDGTGDIADAGTVTERQAEVSPLTVAFTLPIGTQFVQQFGSYIVGVLDAYPALMTGTSVRLFNETTGAQVGYTFAGDRVTCCVVDGSNVYVSTVDQDDDKSWIRRFTSTELIAGSAAAASYEGSLSIFFRSVAVGGGYVWTNRYNGDIVQLDPTTLAEVSVTALQDAFGQMVYDGGYLYFSDVDGNIIKWDVGTKAAVSSFEGVFGHDVLIEGNLLFAVQSGARQLGVYNKTTGAFVNLTVAGTDMAYRNMVGLIGDEVAAVDMAAEQIIFLDKTTGQETRRFDVPGAYAVAGSSDDYLFVAIRAGGAVIDTRAYEPVNDLTSFTFRVYQNSSHVGRGYVAELAL